MIRNLFLFIFVGLMFILFIALLGLFIPMAHGQDSVPHPYAVGGVTMSSGGYQAGGFGAVGAQYAPRHLFLDASGAYEAARKNNDATVGNEHGHTRRLEGVAMLPIGRWAFGGGYTWSKLDTTNYSKSSARPEFGGAYSWKSARLQALYVLHGTDWQNGSQGVRSRLNVQLTRHLFARAELGVFRAHGSVTDPNDPQTTAMELKRHDWFEVANFGMGWRF